MAEFRPAIDYVLWNECNDTRTAGKRIADVGGGFSDDPRDKGGATVYGLSRVIRQREAILPEELGIPDFHPTSLRQVTREAAERCYKRIYWDRHEFYDFTSQDVATKVLDAAVNLNPPAAAYRLLQMVANGLGASLVVDGKLGPITIRAVNALDAQLVLKGLVEALVCHYEAIIAQAHRAAVAAANPALEQDCWREIWLNRAHRLPR